MHPLDAARALMDGLGADANVCAKCGSRSMGLCAPLDAAALDDMSGESERIDFEQRDAIFRQGDSARHVYTLTEGMARLTRVLPDGRQAVIGFRFAGDILGFTPEEEHAFGAEMLTRGTVCRLDRRRLEKMFRRYPVMERRFLDLCVKELSTSQDHILALGRFSAEERVAAFLVSLVEAQQRRGQAGPVFDLPATRADIGEFLGLTLETVSRAVSAFRKRGWIRLHGHSGIELTDREALGSLAAGEGADAA
ncbi:Crp/Fnr family transcriptional regulator [Roseomonas sp. CECT 9278]|uniref:Crp/Fnr family transcriptional regulator n=1 Tax=Roseomonas sp. CECT 9278 TaxID=2845823 RepID=UPI001E5AF368|nr:helix-turn-helix domain-containing protein [Roseomonas sp. CECT 9278]CAH0244827.1 Nitrogen fixation regulation protein FixK [Roseomonas sp. CECT 9278]